MNLRLFALTVSRPACLFLVLIMFIYAPNRCFARASLLVQYDPKLSVDSPSDSLVLPASCGSFDATIPADGDLHLWFVIAAFDVAPARPLGGAAFSLSYDKNAVSIERWGPCRPGWDPFELGSSRWPAPGTAISVVWASPDTMEAPGRFFPIYWFTSRASKASEIQVRPDSVEGHAGKYVLRPQDGEKKFTGFSSMGFGTAGSNACP